MREGGLEPPRPFGHQHLKLARLPFRHSRKVESETLAQCRLDPRLTTPPRSRELLALVGREKFTRTPGSGDGAAGGDRPLASRSTMGLQSIERRLERMVDGVFTSSHPGFDPPDRAGSSSGARDGRPPVASTSRAVASCPTTSRSVLSPATAPASTTSRTRSPPNSSRRPASTPARRATTSWARSRVELAVDTTSRPGRFGIVVAAQAGRPAASAPASLVLPSGQRIQLGNQARSRRPPPRMHDLAQRQQHQPPAMPRCARTGGGYVVTDLDSTNGTLVNGDADHR